MVRARRQHVCLLYADALASIRLAAHRSVVESEKAQSALTLLQLAPLQRADEQHDLSLRHRPRRRGRDQLIEANPYVRRHELRRDRIIQARASTGARGQYQEA